MNNNRMHQSFPALSSDSDVYDSFEVLPASFERLCSRRAPARKPKSFLRACLLETRCPACVAMARVCASSPTRQVRICDVVTAVSDSAEVDDDLLGADSMSGEPSMMTHEMKEEALDDSDASLTSSLGLDEFRDIGTPLPLMSPVAPLGHPSSSSSSFYSDWPDMSSFMPPLPASSPAPEPQDKFLMPFSQQLPPLPEDDRDVPMMAVPSLGRTSGAPVSASAYPTAPLFVDVTGLIRPEAVYPASFVRTTVVQQPKTQRKKAVTKKPRSGKQQPFVASVAAPVSLPVTSFPRVAPSVSPVMAELSPAGSDSDSETSSETSPLPMNHSLMVSSPTASSSPLTDEDDLSTGFVVPGGFGCVECAECLHKIKSMSLDAGDVELTAQMYTVYLRRTAGSAKHLKAAYLDKHFKIRDIKLLRHLVGEHNKKHQTSYKPAVVETVTRNLQKKYKLLDACMNDISIPLGHFLKGKKAVNRAKASLGAREARRYAPYQSS